MRKLGKKRLQNEFTFVRNEQEDDISGNSALSNLYQQSCTECAPSELSDRVLREVILLHRTTANEHNIRAIQPRNLKKQNLVFSPFSDNWRLPMSLAAVVVLSVSVVDVLQDMPLLPTDYRAPSSQLAAVSELTATEQDRNLNSRVTSDDVLEGQNITPYSEKPTAISVDGLRGDSKPMRVAPVIAQTSAANGASQQDVKAVKPATNRLQSVLPLSPDSKKPIETRQLNPVDAELGFDNTNTVASTVVPKPSNLDSSSDQQTFSLQTEGTSRLEKNDDSEQSVRARSQNDLLTSMSYVQPNTGLRLEAKDIQGLLQNQSNTIPAQNMVQAQQEINRLREQPAEKWMKYILQLQRRGDDYLVKLHLRAFKKRHPDFSLIPELNSLPYEGQ